MKIDITDVVSNENKRVTKEVEIDFTSFESKSGNFPIIKKTPFTLQLTNEENKRMLIETEVDVTIEIPCDRCLTPVAEEFHIEVSREVPIGEREAVSEDEDEFDYVDGFNLDVDRLIYGEILVNWPTKVLCKEDCKGICRICGVNLNTQTCDCQKTELDPRMAAIQDIFNKFKEV